MKLIIPLFFILIFFRPENKDKIVYIQPLGNVEIKYMDHVKKTLNNFYGYKCIVNPRVNLTNDLLSKSKKRYDGLKILKKFNTNRNILIITEKDITTKKGNIDEWGVLGLGFRPGTVCVVSTFRMKRDANEKKILDRLKKVSIHEVGHNMGLDHCKNDIKCMMNDAKGTITQIDREKFYFCEKCKNQIGLK
jgi:archaemetzincin